MKKALLLIVLVLGLAGMAGRVFADVQLASGFGSNMVLQCDVQARLAGWADEGEKVTVKLGGKVVGEVTGFGKARLWTVVLPVQKAGPIPDIVVEGRNRIVLTGLLAGDVWVCSGQSNMYMSLQKGKWCGYGGALNADQEVAEANHPQIRLYRGKAGEWLVCSPESAAPFSAAGYFFGRELHKRLNVPIGLVQAAVGGTEAELWVPRKVREAWPGFAAELEKAGKLKNASRPAAKELLDEYNDQIHWANAVLGTGKLYDSMIEPLTSMRIKGAIWYQGESNSRHAAEYPELMAHLIGGWRQAWQQPDLPFLIMQLVNFDFPSHQPWYKKGTFADLRGAQQKTADTVPNTGIAIGLDIGSPNIHPPNKQEVGRRLALVALKQVYGQDVVAAGPRLKDVKFEAGRAVLSFDAGGKDQKLDLKAGVTNGFELAGADGKFVPAAAELKADTITLTAAGLSQPAAVRYAWYDWPEVSLFNTAGLPAAPFLVPAGR